jgi:hypothetical protein
MAADADIPVPVTCLEGQDQAINDLEREKDLHMKIIAASLLAALLAAGCTTTEKRATGGAVVGAGAGAVIGGIAGGGRGAVIGAAVGGATGAVIGAATTPGDCVYRRKDGTKYVARCP